MDFFEQKEKELEGKFRLAVISNMFGKRSFSVHKVSEFDLKYAQRSPADYAFVVLTEDEARALVAVLQPFLK